MTKDEFNSRQRAMNRYGRTAALFWTLGFGVLGICGALAKGYLGEQMHSLFAVCFLTYFLGGIFFVILLNRRRQKDLKLCCPNCGKPFFKTTAQIVVATGNCGYCGEKIIDGE